MPEGNEEKPAFHVRAAEIVTAGGFFAIGAIVIIDSLRLGMGWKEDGPQAGYFPFYIGAIICVSALVNFVAAIFAGMKRNPGFVERGQLKLVLSVLLPTAVYVGLIGWIGIYVASALFVALFMRWLGAYAWWKVATVSVGNSVVFFLIFEVWFLIPLPKGPLESWLGLN
jgi:putative tricarboxylic transport membrane protein